VPNPNNPAFPAALATDNTLMVASNRAISTLELPVNSSQTTMTVANGTIFQYPCLVQIDTEVIYVGSVTGNVLQSLVRGFGLTSATTHAQNAQVKGYVFSYHHNQVTAEIKAIEAALGVNLGNVVTQTDTAGGDLMNTWSTLALQPTGITPGTYGGFDVSISMHVRADGRIDSITNATGNRNYPIIYKAAIVQGNNAVLGFSFANTNAPNAVIYDDTSGNGSLYAVAAFTQGNAYWVQDHFYLPNDWIGDTISLDLYFRTPATAGNITWTCQTGKLAPGDAPNLALFNPASVTTTVPGVAYETMQARITPLILGGVPGSLAAGDEFFFKLSRSATDTAAGQAELISIKFNINRNFALGS
jgi:hypothetical protein